MAVSETKTIHPPPGYNRFSADGKCNDLLTGLHCIGCINEKQLNSLSCFVFFTPPTLNPKLKTRNCFTSVAQNAS